ncbi:hypothetical protein ACQP2Y_21115 [Actinoplanes sp. CA-051413]|uniref:hypothetical protein n=1 Tax=Actinoplanes sp. CA-051413 TaxID=3239899 RepID=UPI003D95A3DE
MNLLIDPELLNADANTHDRPNAYINRHAFIRAAFGYYSADPLTGPRCGRCNDLLHVHLWQLVDDGDVIDCGRRQ